ncbi:MAG: nucleotidyltransferase family protein [Fibrella sp.]|nr:nucleotidyltransferase family protein [Armatimonadota bacterium]
MFVGDAVKPLPVAAVILAAGGSTRLGEPKQLLRYQGEPLVARAVRSAGDIGSSPVVVVTGANAAAVEAALQPVPFARPVFNADWQAGMGSSIRTGIAAVLASDIFFDAVLLLVCDQPLVDETLLLRLCEAYRATEKKIVAAEYGDAWGVPCLFERSVLPELATLTGSGGAKPVIERCRRTGDAISIPFPGGAFDVDTPADWERWQETEADKTGEPT